MICPSFKSSQTGFSAHLHIALPQYSLVFDIPGVPRLRTYPSTTSFFPLAVFSMIMRSLSVWTYLTSSRRMALQENGCQNILNCKLEIQMEIFILILLLIKTIAAFDMPLHNLRFWHGLDRRKLGCMIHKDEKRKSLKSLMQHVSTLKSKNSRGICASNYLHVYKDSENCH